MWIWSSFNVCDLFTCDPSMVIWWIKWSKSWSAIDDVMKSLSVSRPTVQIPQCIRQISHNVPFCNRNVHTCAHFCYKMVHCGIWDWCIMGFVKQIFRAAKCYWSAVVCYGNHLFVTDIFIIFGQNTEICHNLAIVFAQKLWNLCKSGQNYRNLYNLSLKWVSRGWQS